MKKLFSTTYSHSIRIVVFSILFATTIASAQTIVTSIQPYYSLTTQIAPNADVHRLLAIGASPHNFEPKPSQIRRVANADLIIINGVIDAWVYDIIDASKSNAIVVNLMQELEFESIEDHAGHDHAGYSNTNHPDAGNPHIWLNPALMEKAVHLIANHLAKIDAPQANSFENNANRLGSDLHRLDNQISIRLRPHSREAFIPFHNAWAHFADHYHLNLLLEIEPAAGKEPTAHYLAEALTQITASKAKAIFSEAQLSQRPAEVVANNAKVDLHQLDPIGGVEGRESYQAMMRYNVATIIQAFK